jgi:miniconductance mechanosensitive channel
MDIAALQVWIEQNPAFALLIVIGLSIVGFLIARVLLARSLTAISRRTKTRVDDILVRHLRPFRIAWLAPLIIIYAFAYLVPTYQAIVETSALFLIVWICAITLIALLDALNEIYENSASFKGASIQGYLDILKILVVIAAVILSISMITGKPPTTLLAGLGALTAVLLLIFQETILSFVASVQIGTQDLIKEGDWIEVPSYEADGDVVNITLHTIEVQNFDKTISYIPTRKIAEVAFKNWRGMQESGGRRIKRAIYLDLGSIRFCDREMIDRFRKVDILQPFIDRKVREIENDSRNQDGVADSPLDGLQLTNLGAFRAYIEAYLHHHPGIHSDGMVFLVRQLAPGPTGVPLELYVFTKTTEWEKYERFQAGIFDHLLAAVPIFDLRVFQEPTGMDFYNLARPAAPGSAGL